MNSYTSNIEANLIIEQQVKKISEYIRVELGDHLIALLLAGSFGRGEGSIEVCGENSYKPINDYDFVLIDSMPSLGLMTLNVLSACDSVLIPATAEYLSAKGLELLLNAYFGNIRTPIPVVSGQRIGNIRTVNRDIRTLQH